MSEISFEKKSFLNRSDPFHLRLTEGSLVLSLTSSCVVDDVPDFELTVYKRQETLSSRLRRRYL